MSNIDREKEYDNPTDWFNFASNQILKDLYICLPAIIKSYDTATKRAKVKIALNQVTTSDVEMEYPIIADVPVIFLSNSKYIIQFPMQIGDNVLIIFSQRGLDQFKLTYAQSLPSKHGFFSLNDAIAIPGFGELENTIAQEDALNIQTTDGSTFIALNPDNINITANNVTINSNDAIINATTTTINGDLIVNGNVSATTLDINGALLPPDHKHGGVQSGIDDTGIPIP